MKSKRLRVPTRSSRSSHSLRPTPERLAKDEWVEVNPADIDLQMPIGRTLRCVTQTPLDRYARRREIEPRQYAVGERLGRLWRAAGLEPRLIANLLGAGGGGAPVLDQRVDGQTRLIHVLRALPRQLVPVLVHVVGLELYADDWARRHGHHPKSGLAVLRLALDALADHWGA